MRRDTGFTLIEVLIAIALFVVISLMAYQGLDSVVRQKAVLDERTSAQEQLQLAIQLMQWDLAQAIGRPVRDPYGGTEVAMRSGGNQGALLEFTRGGEGLLPGQTRSALARVRYRLDGQQLLRDRVTQLDALNPALVQTTLLLDGVQTVSFEFIDAAGARFTDWPPPSAEEETGDRLPRVVQLTLEHQRWGELLRLFLVQG